MSFNSNQDTPAPGLDGSGYGSGNAPVWTQTKGGGWIPSGWDLTGATAATGSVPTKQSNGSVLWVAGAGGATIDTTATDIQPLGTRAAGSVGEAADAGHVHPMPRLDQVGAPTASVAMGGQKLTGLANGTASTDSAAYGQLASWPATIVTASGTVNVPTGPSSPTHARVTVIGGGGGGGGGGSAGGAAPTSTQTGGSGGGAGASATQVIALGAATTGTATVGAGGAGGTGGAAGTGSAGGAATNGGNGGTTSLVINGITISAPGGSYGVGSAANSSGSVNSGQYGQAPNSNQGNALYVPGSGGTAASGVGYAPGPVVGYSGRGGGGGGPASATVGGSAGSSANTQSHTATPAGGSATAAPANTGQGGDGGGGGSYNSGTTPGAGGNGGAGGSGQIIIEWLP